MKRLIILFSALILLIVLFSVIETSIEIHAVYTAEEEFAFRYKIYKWVELMKEIVYGVIVFFLAKELIKTIKSEK